MADTTLTYGDELERGDRDETRLVREIKAHISKGTQLGAKAEQHFISAGLHLTTLRAWHKERGGTWAEWEELLKTKIGLASRGHLS